jgi:hypothetical protein
VSQRQGEAGRGKARRLPVTPAAPHVVPSSLYLPGVLCCVSIALTDFHVLCCMHSGREVGDKDDFQVRGGGVGLGLRPEVRVRVRVLSADRNGQGGFGGRAVCANSEGAVTTCV